MRRLVLGTGMGFEQSTCEQIYEIANVGFEGIFTHWDENNGNKAFKKAAADADLFYQSIHAPFEKSYLMWEEGEEGERETDRQIRCLRAAAEVEVPIVVMHAIIGFDRFTPTDIGAERFGKLLNEAESLGIKIALENTEGECYLRRLMTEHRNNKALGFCIDTGHEMCYNHSQDLITEFGDKLIATHLNDNMKITGDKITWLDDSHLLPFDGLADWQGIANRLNAVGYEGPLTFELTSKNKPERNTHDIYKDLDFKSFLALAYKKASEFRCLIEKHN